MVQSLPLVLVPGLTCTARLYGPQIAALWPFGQVTVADHRRDADMAAIAARILERCAAAFRARRAVDGRLHRLRHAAAGARAHRQAGAARHLGAPRHAGADRGAQHANRHGAVGPLRRDSGSVDPALSECEASARRAPDDDRASDGRWKPGRRPSCASSRRSCRGRIRGRCWRRSAARRWCWSATATSRRRRNSTRKSPPASPGAKLTIVPDCGHLSTLEQPEAVNAALAEWLGALNRAGRLRVVAEP